MMPTVETRIFIVGVPRSGTTLVQSLLATHSAVTSFTESHFFSRHFRLLPALSTAVLVQDPAPRLRAFLVENNIDEATAGAILTTQDSQGPMSRFLRPLRSRSVARSLLDVLDHLARTRGRSAWVEKTAQHLHYIPFLERVQAPGRPAHFIHVIRDGLDVVSSLHSASQAWERRPYAFARGPAPPYDVPTCVKRWNADVAISLGRVTSPNDHFVFYEDLTARPEDTLRPLLAALGLSWEPGILQEFARTADSLTVPTETWKRVAPQIRQSSTAKGTLTAAQRATAERSLDVDLYARLHQRAAGRFAA